MVIQVKCEYAQTKGCRIKNSVEFTHKIQNMFCSARLTYIQINCQWRFRARGLCFFGGVNRKVGLQHLESQCCVTKVVAYFLTYFYRSRWDEAVPSSYDPLLSLHSFKILSNRKYPICHHSFYISKTITMII